MGPNPCDVSVQTNEGCRVPFPALQESQQLLQEGKYELSIRCTVHTVQGLYTF